MSTQDIVERARAIATYAHSGQYRNDGITPYITHPEAVAATFEHLNTLQSIAWLHDVIEDTTWTAQDLIDEGIPTHIVQFVMILSQGAAEDYDHYLTRVKESEPAKQVKIADIIHNMRDLTPRNRKKLLKYSRALIFLLDEDKS